MSWSELMPLYPKRPSAPIWSDTRTAGALKESGIYEIGFIVPGFRTPYHQDSRNAYPEHFRAVYVGKAKNLGKRLKQHSEGGKHANAGVREFRRIHRKILAAGNKYGPLRQLVATCLPLETESVALKTESQRIIKGYRQLWYGWNNRYEWKPSEEDFISLILDRSPELGSWKEVCAHWKHEKKRIRKTATMVHEIGGVPIPKMLSELGLWPYMLPRDYLV